MRKKILPWILTVLVTLTSPFVAYPEVNLDELNEALGSEDRRTRRSAVKTLEQIVSDPQAVIPILANALRDEDEMVKESVTTILGKIGVDAVPTLIEALQDEDMRTRFYAAVGLSLIGPDAQYAVPDLINVLQDEKWIRRLEAARALKKVKGEATPS
ncbi:MAG: HEAT repeat domain-containing protein [Candidatus Bipolaricaulia bacterium]